MSASSIRDMSDQLGIRQSEQSTEKAQRSGAHHRFNNDLRYRDDAHEMQRQLTPRYVLEPVREAAAAGSRVVLLMPSHTDTRLFHRAVDTASHVVFIKGRVKFGILRDNGRQEAASHPSCLICWNLPDPSPLAHLGRVWDLTLPPEGSDR